MSAQISEHHLRRPAYIDVRQSTMGQVRQHQQSTERQYALREKALALGWSGEAVRILDRDLGQSGAQSHNREDFQEGRVSPKGKAFTAAMIQWARCIPQLERSAGPHQAYHSAWLVLASRTLQRSPTGTAFSKRYQL